MDSHQTYKRTRLAPTPSGYLHLGNILSFAITAGMARRHGANILLRIDDLDHQRVRREYVQDIFDTLSFLGISWDEGPRHADDFFMHWSQQQRMHLYRGLLEQLRADHHVFACACSRSDLMRHSNRGHPCTCIEKNLSLDNDSYAWRIRRNIHHQIPFRTVKRLFEQSALPGDMQHFIVRKKGGAPSYQLSSLADDLHFGVDLIVRGEDLLPSTLAQHVLASLLPENHFDLTVFLHHHLLTDPSGGKLSKSAGATSIRHLRQKGFTKKDVFHQLSALLQLKDPVSDGEELFAALTSNAANNLFH